MKLGSVLILPAAALRTTAAVLRLAAGTGRRIADLISPDSDTPTQRDVAAAPAPVRPAVAAAPAPVPAPTDPARFDAAELAARTAPSVIAALESLGTVELADLYEYESQHRRRPEVLDAITAATAPPPSATDDVDLSLLDDVRVPDELVYSTQTPQR